MAQYDYDLFVIGAGSGGVRAARLAAMSGAKVAVAEEHRVGGTCVVRGCIPKKFMVYASEFSSSIRSAEGFGWSIKDASFDWSAFLVRKDNEISRLSGVYVANLENAGAHLIHARATLTDPHTLAIDGQDKTVTAAKVLIATGARPTLPDDLPGVEHAITSNEAFHIKELPRSIVIAGGGYIATEFAGIFNGLGVETTLVYRGPIPLRGFDDDVRRHVMLEMERRGVTVIVGCRQTSLEKTKDGVVSHLSSGHTLNSDITLFATGRSPYTDGLGLDAAGVTLNDAGAVVVDDYSRTNVEHIWAVGDVTDRLNLTPVAIREAAAFAQSEFYGKPTRFDHENVASAVFSQPPVGSVGMTEAQARQGGRKVVIYRSIFRPMKATFYGGDERMLIKLVVDGGDDRILGCHVVGPDAPEIIQMAAISVKLGITKAQWDDTCAVHPTAAEELVTMREPYTPMEL